MQLINGDCLEAMAALPDSSVDAIVTDPPYGLSFMGKAWDYDVPQVEVWREALRVLKPGGHLLSFFGSRTYHRGAVQIEDAGFEIRDQIMWIYGSGFPKSLDVSKAIDKCNGDPNRLHKFTAWMRTTGVTARQLDQITDTNMGGHYLTAASQPAIPTVALWKLIRPLCGDVPAWVDELVQRIEAEREVVGNETKARSTSGKSALPTVGGETVYETWDITAPATDAAKQWDGWGTALKPAHEPVVMARKPLIGTVAANVMEHGTGAINVDGCRVGTEAVRKNTAGGLGYQGGEQITSGTGTTMHTDGRWPANVIHDGSDEVVELFPQADGMRRGTLRRGATTGLAMGAHGIYGEMQPMEVQAGYGDSGSAARFFYCAKANKADRGEGNTHPTVKPTDLMRYLCRLVTPPGGVVLDPFMGSGSTGKAALLEGFDFIGIERDPNYYEIAQQRVCDMEQPSLFSVRTVREPESIAS